MTIKNSAYTLIELIILITALGLLGGLFVHILKPQDQAHDTTLVSTMNEIILNIEGYKNSYGEYPNVSDDCSCEEPEKCLIFNGLGNQKYECVNNRSYIPGNVLWFRVPGVNGSSISTENEPQNLSEVFRYQHYEGGCLTTVSVINKPKLYAWKFGGELMLCDPGETINPAEKVCSSLYSDGIRCFSLK